MRNQHSDDWLVLIVDDDEDDYLLTRSMLKEAGGRAISLEWAPTYEAAMQLLRSRTYDAVLVDYDLGPRTGLELIRETVASGYPAPLILYTGRGSYEVDVEAMQAGATLYLTKEEATPLLLERFLRYAIERKRDQEQLKRHLQERADILESIQDGFFSINRDWLFTYVNQRAALNIDSTPEAMIGQNLWEVYPRLIGSHIETNYRSAMQERRSIQFEARGLYSTRWYSISVYPSIEGISVYWRDISEQKRLEEEVLSQAQFPEENPNPVMRVSATGELLYANTAAKAILLVWNCGDRFCLPESLLAAASDALKRGEAKQLEIDCVDKTYVFTLAPIKDQGYVNLYGVDITRRKRMEVEIYESEMKYRELVQYAPVAIYEIDFQSQKFISVNDAMCAITGYSREELLEMNPLDILDEESQLVFRERTRNWLAGETPERNVEYRALAKDGHEIYAVLNVTFKSDQTGKPLGATVVGYDITARKQAEEIMRAYNEQLKRSNEILEDFAFTASHDLREPLRKVKAFTDRLVKQSGSQLDRQSLDYLTRMDQAAERMQSMLDGLLAYSRVTNQGNPFVEVDLNQLAAEVLSDLDVQLKETGGKVKLGKLPVIQADPVQIYQLLQNLIGNAIKFHKPNFPPLVNVSSRWVKNDYVELIIEDNGIGFDNTLTDGLFKPFHRLVGKSEYEGTGMGLAICQKIAERHEGSIKAQGEVGKGATFTVTLPCKLVQ